MSDLFTFAEVLAKATSDLNRIECELMDAIEQHEKFYEAEDLRLQIERR